MSQETQSAGQTQNDQKKEWYKKWWGVIIAIFILPYFLLWYMWAKTNWAKSVKWTITGVLIFFSILGLTGESQTDTTTQQPAQQVAQQPVETKVQVQEVKEEKQPASTTENSQPVPVVETLKPQEVKIPKYEIVYESKNERYDGGIIYYILIDKVNLANDSFKNDIKTIIKQLVKDKGAKISINFFDNKSSLELKYKSIVERKIMTKAELTQQESHLIAMFSGELKTDIYLNTLSFFPGTFTDNPPVGKFVENLEFNPGE